jgi:hypothetical protein
MNTYKMIFKIPGIVAIALLSAVSFTGCTILRQSSKYNFNDGEYQTRRFARDKVYVLRVAEDTIAVFPVKEFPDSTAILTNKRTNYTSQQKKLKDNKASHVFYRPSFDIDLMTIPIKYRPALNGFPNQLNNNFSGAFYGGYRIDAYHLNYKRTPLNVYKQNVHHIGYSAGLYAGIGNTLIDGSTLANPAFPVQYEGVLLLTGIAANMAAENLTFGISLGTDHLMDKYHEQWIYENRPCIGFTLGLNLN